MKKTQKVVADGRTKLQGDPLADLKEAHGSAETETEQGPELYDQDEKSVNESPDSSDLVVDLPKYKEIQGVPAEVASEWKPDLLETTHSSATLIQVKISL